MNNGIRGNAGRPNFNALHAQLYTGMGDTTKWRGHGMLYYGNYSASDQFSTTVKSVLRPKAEVISRVRARFVSNYAGYASIDFEGARWNICDSQNAAGYASMVSWTKEAWPGSLVGHYDVGLCNAGYGFAIGPGGTTANYNLWHARNEGLRPVQNAADVWFGSLYPRFLTSAEYVGIARDWLDEQVLMTGGVVKESYPIVAPQYKFHTGPNTNLHQSPVPKEYFRAILDVFSSQFARDRGVQGIVIWTGHQGKTWDQLKVGGWWDAIWEFLGFSGPPAT